MNILLVCSRNQWRSPTAEAMWRKHSELSVRSAGTSKSARRRVAERDIGWADVIFAMEDSHKERLRYEFRNALQRKRIEVLDIPDDYGFMDPELISLLDAAVAPFLVSALEERR